MNFQDEKMIENNYDDILKMILDFNCSERLISWMLDKDILIVGKAVPHEPQEFSKIYDDVEKLFSTNQKIIASRIEKDNELKIYVSDRSFLV